ncbi:hypothetical protein ACFTQL_18020 [Peribacillus butanolivorans]|uniref:hypothetical protein n=1 Tax=Peribacillus butanolivorans TaxID=421767 RepID=UPI003630BBA2
MNRLYNEESGLHSLRSVYYYQSALTNYLKAFLTMLEAEFKIGDDKTIADTVYRLIKNVNELQKFMNQRIEMFSLTFPEKEIYYIYLEYKPLNDEHFPQCVRQLQDLSSKCLCTTWKRKRISEEVNQFFKLYNRQKKMMNEFQSISK